MVIDAEWNSVDRMVDSGICSKAELADAVVHIELSGKAWTARQGQTAAAAADVGHVHVLNVKGEPIGIRVLELILKARGKGARSNRRIGATRLIVGAARQLQRAAGTRWVGRIGNNLGAALVAIE